MKRTWHEKIGIFSGPKDASTVRIPALSRARSRARRSRVGRLVWLFTGPCPRSPKSLLFFDVFLFFSFFFFRGPTRVEDDAFLGKMALLLVLLSTVSLPSMIKVCRYLIVFLLNNLAGPYTLRRFLNSIRFPHFFISFPMIPKFRKIKNRCFVNFFEFFSKNIYKSNYELI